MVDANEKNLCSWGTLENPPPPRTTEKPRSFIHQNTSKEVAKFTYSCDFPSPNAPFPHRL